MQQHNSMDYHASIPIQDLDHRGEDNEDLEDQEVGSSLLNRQSVIKFKDVGDEDDLEREVRKLEEKNIYNFLFLPDLALSIFLFFCVAISQYLDLVDEWKSHENLSDFFLETSSVEQ